MTNLGIKSSQLSDIRAALLDSSKNNTLEPRKNENFGNQIKGFWLESLNWSVLLFRLILDNKFLKNIIFLT